MKRRANILAGLLNNFQTANEMVMKTSESINTATESQEKLLETSAGQIKKMSSNWQVFAGNVVSSDAVFNALEYLNNLLEDANNRMAADRQAEVISKQLFGDETYYQKLITRSVTEAYQSSEFKDAAEQFQKALTSEDTGELQETLSQLQGYQNEIGRLSQRIAQFKEAGLDYTSQGLKDTQLEMVALIEEMSESGIKASDLEKTIISLTEKINELGEVSDSNPVPDPEPLTAYEKALNGVVDITDSATSEMLSDFEYYSNEKQQAIIDGMKQQIEATKVDIQAVKTRMAAYDELSNKIREANALTGASISLEKEYMRSLGASVLKDEENKLNDLIEKLNREQESLNNLFDGGGTTSSTSATQQPLSKLEITIRDLRHEIDLLDAELDRTDSYDKQIEITNKLISKQEELKLELIDQANAQYEVMLAEEDNTRAKQDAMEEYQKMVMDINKVTNTIDKLEDSIVSLNDEQKKLMEDNISDYIKRMRDGYDEYFDEQQRKYEDDLESFEKAQEKKIKAVEESIKRLREQYATEEFIDEEQKLLDAIAKLEKEKAKLKIATTTGDLEAKRRTAEIDEQLAIENESLEDLRREREFTLEEQALQDKKEKLEEETDKRKEEYDNQIRLLDNYQRDVENRLDGFENSWETFSGNIGDTFSENVNSVIDSMYSNLQDFTNEFNKVSGTKLEIPEKPTPGNTDQIDKPSEDRLDLSGKRGRLAEAFERKYNRMPSNKELTDLQEKYKIYHNGGLVGSGTFSGMSGMEALEYSLKGNEVKAILQKGEGVFTQPQMQDIANNTNNTNVEVYLENVNIGQDYDNLDEFSKDLTSNIKRDMASKGQVIRGRGGR